MNKVVINFLNKVSYTSYFANPLHPLTPPSLLSLLLTPPFPTPLSFQVPYHSDKFSQEAWLVQQLKERERVVRGKENDVLPMQTCAASEQVGTVHLMNVSYSVYHSSLCALQECAESLKVLWRAWEGVERCSGRLSPGLLEEIRRLGQGMLDFVSQGGALASYDHR